MGMGKSRAELKSGCISACTHFFFSFLTDQKWGNEVKVESHEGNKCAKNERTVLKLTGENAAACFCLSLSEFGGDILWLSVQKTSAASGVC